MFGTLIVTIIEAKLTRNTELLGKMDPFVIMQVRDYVIRTKVKNSAGKNPVWNETFCFRLNEDEIIKFDIWDDEALKDNVFVGNGSFKVNGFREKKKTSFPVFYQGGNIGNIFMELEFVQELIEEEVVRKTEKRMTVQIEEHLNEKISLLHELSKLQTELNEYKKKINNFTNAIEVKDRKYRRVMTEIQVNKSDGIFGNLEISNIKGNFTRNTASFAKMSPYCYFYSSNKKRCFKLAPLKNGGKNPEWEDNIQIEVCDENVILIEAISKHELGSDSMIGEGVLSLKNINLGITKNNSIKLFYKGIDAGELIFDCEFNLKY